MPRSILPLAVAALVLVAGCGSSTPDRPTAEPLTTRAPGTTAAGPGTTVAATGDTAPAAPTPGDAVSILNYAFVPGTLQAPVGSTVTWSNDETNPPVDHWVRSIPSAEKVLDSGRMAPGVTYQQPALPPGTYPYYCVIHNFMKGTLVVG